jgi:hypothetical protein
MTRRPHASFRTRCLRVALLACCQAAWMTAWAQEAPPAGNDPARQGQKAPDAAKGREFPLDVAGYLSFRSLNDDSLDEHRFYREYSGSIFLSKTIGRWSFHSEFNASNAPEYDAEGLHLFPRRPSLSVKLDSGFVNYNWRDWLQGEAGFLFIPTYWRTHHYQSTTLTVDEPLADQNVFPTAIKGVMLHGDRYFEGGGISYQFYGGAGQEPDLDTNQEVRYRSGVMGGKLVFHVPTRLFFDTFDIGYQQLRERHESGRGQETYGGEMLLEKGRARLLAEFAYASIGPMDVSPGRVRSGYFRQGYYVQPSYGITRQLSAVARYERLNSDSRHDDVNALARQLVGLTYRPAPALSLKLEADRFQPQQGRLPAYYGASLAIVYFFRLP